MVEIKMSFSTLADATAFLTGRTIGSSFPDIKDPGFTTPKVDAPKPAKSAKADTNSAAPAVTASAVVESKSAEEKVPVATPSPTPPAEPAKIDYATSDMPGRIAALVDAKRKDEVVALLAQFGAKKGPEVKTEDLPAFSIALKALEDKQPEESLG